MCHLNVSVYVSENEKKIFLIEIIHSNIQYDLNHCVVLGHEFYFNFIIFIRLRMITLFFLLP